MLKLSLAPPSFPEISVLKQVVLKVNDRQLLISALEPFATDQVDVYSLIQSIDKLDKLPPEAVQQELESKGSLLKMLRRHLKQ